MADQLNTFRPIYSELHYQLCSSELFNGYALIYSPEEIVKVLPISVIDRIEYLFAKKRFEEALALIDQQRYDSLTGSKSEGFGLVTSELILKV